MRKIIVDCDPGMDDSSAIIMAVKNPNLDIQAVTTVPNPSGGPAVWMSLDYMLSLAAGDSLTVFYSQNSTATLYVIDVKAALFRVR